MACNFRTSSVKDLAMMGVILFALAGCGGGSSLPPSKILTRIQIAPSNSTVTIGATLQFSASGTYNDGSTGDVTNSVQWTSSEATLASISSGGQATGIAVGRPKITANSGSLSDATQLLVVNGTTNTVPRFTFVANMQDGTLSELVVNADSGQLRHNGYQVVGTSPSSVSVEPRGKFVYVANADSNSISAFQIAASGALTAVSGAPFDDSGNPLALAIDPTGSFLYSANSGGAQVAGYAIDPAAGTLKELAGSPYTAAAGTNALTIEPSGRFLYATNGAANSISEYAIAPDTGVLSAVAGSPIPGGTAPSALSSDPSGQMLYVANSGTADVSAFSIAATSGALSPVAGSPFKTGAGPEISGLTVSADGKFVYVANFGSSSVSGFSVGTGGALAQMAGSPFAVDASPRGVLIDPTRKFAYVPALTACEVEIYSIDANGALAVINRVRTRQQAAAIAFAYGSAPVTYTPKFLYATNLGSNNLASFAIDPATGSLSTLPTSPNATGSSPFGVAADPSGRFIYVTNGVNNTTLKADQSISAYTAASDGSLTPIPGSPFPAGNDSTGITVDPSGRFVFAANFSDGTVSAYSIDAVSGALTELSGSPYPTGLEPQAIRIEPTGRFLYVGLNEFQIDPVSGELTALPQTAPSPFGGPSDIAADPTGKFLYFAHQGEARVSQYLIDAISGELTYLAATTPPQSSAAVSLAVEPTGRFVIADISQFTPGQTINSFAIDPATGELPPNPTMTLPTAALGFFYLSMDPSGKYVYVADQGAGKIWGFQLDAATGELSLISTTPWVSGTATISVAVTGTIQ